MIPDELLARSERVDECLVWRGANNGIGYGLHWSNGKKRYVHRLVMESVLGRALLRTEIVDHTCFNRACLEPTHLRVCTNKQNLENRRGATSRSASGVRGVSWDKGTRKWRARVTSHGRHYCGGLFVDIEDAERAAIALRATLFTHSDVDNHPTQPMLPGVGE